MPKRSRSIKIVSEGYKGYTQVYDAETGECLSDNYSISDVTLFLYDGRWTASIEFADVELEIVAEEEDDD